MGYQALQVEGGAYTGLGGDWKRGPCEGVVIVPVGGGRKGLVDGGGRENVCRVWSSANVFHLPQTHVE
jgi:hypothetical protein